MVLTAAFSLSTSSLPAFATGVLNHLWQSTLFVGAVGLLTLLLRRNSARLRYWLWLIASAKFLLPFSLLMAIGAQFAPPRTTQPVAAFTVITRELAQPIAINAVARETSRGSSLVTRVFPLVILGVWFAGSATIFRTWLLRWRRVTKPIRGITPAKSGREFEALQHLQTAGNGMRPMDLLISPTALEPGIAGLFRPVLLLPEGIGDRLSDSQLVSIIAHELCHARHRDNFTAAFHMLVEAVFWFHPLVWWLGGRLVHERERACDEEVLNFGCDSRVYAEAILRVCKFYLESPLFCAAGVTSSNLRRRIEAIMNYRPGNKLGWGKKLLLVGAGVAAISGPVAIGSAYSESRAAATQSASGSRGVPAYQSVSIVRSASQSDGPQMMLAKPEGFSATNVSLRTIIIAAYGIQESQLVGGPDWIAKQKWDVEAKAGSSALEEIKKRNEHPPLLPGQMLQALLAERFKLKFHRESRQMPILSLVPAEGGTKLVAAKPGDNYTTGYLKPDGGRAGPGLWIETKGRTRICGQGVPVALLARLISGEQNQTVVDQTGLAGNYDFTLIWTPEPSPSGNGSEKQAWPHAFGPSFLEALRGQLGLKLSAEQKAVEIVVIDQAAQP